MARFHLKGIKSYKSKGKQYYYDRQTGKRINARYGTVEFIQEVLAIREAAANKGPIIKKGTLGALIIAYQSSPEFKGLAPRTQKDYRSYSKDLDKFRDLVLVMLKPEHVTKIRNKIEEKRTRDRANRIKTYMTTLFNWAIPYGHMSSNPAKKVNKLKKTHDEKLQEMEDQANRPWELNEVRHFLKNTYPEMRTAVALAVSTSLREQDVIIIPWTAIKDGRIFWRHSKNVVPLDMPIPSGLAPILAESRKSAKTIVVGKRGKSYAGEDGFRSNFNKERNRLAELGLIGKDCTFHGLRHTILTLIADEGGSNAEIMAVSGHLTESQVKRYTKNARRKKSAEKAIGRVEQSFGDCDS